MSLFKEKYNHFKSISRAKWSLYLLGFLYALSFFLPLLAGKDALLVKYNETYHWPALKKWVEPLYKTDYLDASFFGQKKLFGKPYEGEPHYRELQKQWRKEDSKNWLILPFYSFGPNENLLDEMEGNPPTRPDKNHWLGTDNRGRDVFARLLYGFNLSMSFAFLVTLSAFVIGIFIGAVLGYFGGKVDLLGVRFIEIISLIPFLYFSMILVSFMKPSFFLLVAILIFAGSWVGISMYVRGEFLKEKSKSYVTSARAIGCSHMRIMFVHIFPNALTPVITFFPFALVGNISALVALDFLSLGLPPPTPSWGELLNQGVNDIRYWWLVASPLVAMFCTLLGITFIGEGLREAFHPKGWSRYR